MELKNDVDPENQMGLGYPSSKSQIADIYEAFKDVYKGVFIGNCGYTP